MRVATVAALLLLLGGLVGAWVLWAIVATFTAPAPWGPR